MSGAIGGEEDEAVQAFEALRTEVANLRRGIELVYQGQGAGRMTRRGARRLQPDAGRDGADAAGPAGAAGRDRGQAGAGGDAGGLPGADRGGGAARGGGRRPGLGRGRPAQSAATRALREVTSQVREAHEQRRSLVMAGAIGVLGGVFLWFMSVALLPLGAGDWLAALPLGGGPWQAGEALMQRDSPAAFDRMARLYRACGGQATELCEGAITARAIQAGQEGGKAASALAPSHPLPRGGRAGQQGQ